MQESLERWLPVVGYEGLYEVSSHGRVRSLDRPRPQQAVGRGMWPRKGRILKLRRDSRTGYLTVGLSAHGKQTTRKVHALVAEAFIGPRPKGQYVRHGSADKTDNRACNLCYGTPAENSADALRDGTRVFGERCGTARLTAEQVRQARKLIADGPYGTQAQLARAWGVSSQVLCHAMKGRSWNWID